MGPKCRSRTGVGVDMTEKINIILLHKSAAKAIKPKKLKKTRNLPEEKNKKHQEHLKKSLHIF